MKWGVREGRQEAGFRRVLALRRKTFEGIAKGGRVDGNCRLKTRRNVTNNKIQIQQQQKRNYNDKIILHFIGLQFLISNVSN